jgi:hypothetical protein
VAHKIFDLIKVVGRASPAKVEPRTRPGRTG